ncbi:MAG: DUF6017 domain-containing protein [Wujia sp.]
MKNFIIVEKELLSKGIRGNALRLYLMMLDRASLSKKNGYIDEESGEVYIIMTVKEICARLSVCKRTAASALGDLEAARLITRKKQGLGKPQRILVTYQAAHCDNNITHSVDACNNISPNSCNFYKNKMEYADDQRDTVFKMTEYDTTEYDFYVEWWDHMQPEDCPVSSDTDQDEEPDAAGTSFETEESSDAIRDVQEDRKEHEASGIELHFRRCKKLHFQRCKKLHPNNIKYNNTKSDIYNINNLSYQDDGNSYMNIRHTFLEHIDYDILAGTVSPDIMSVMADVTADTLSSGKQYIQVAGQKRTYQDVYNRLMSIDSSHVEYISECIARTTVPVRNPRSYMLACLYNAPATIDAYYELQAGIDMSRQTAGIC